MNDEKKKLLDLIRAKLQNVIDTHHEFADKTKLILDSLVNLHVFDPGIDMLAKAASLDDITHKLVKMAAAKKDGNVEEQARLKKELIVLYKELLK